MLGPRVRRDSASLDARTTARRSAAITDGAELEEDTRVYKPGLADPNHARARLEPRPAFASQPETAGERSDARPLLGQDDLVTALRVQIDAAFRERRAHVIVIEGEPGSGKTRMLQRASEIAAALDPTVEVHYAALRSRDDGPYAPLSRLLLDRFGITPASSPAAVRREMEAVVADVLANTPGDETAPLLGQLAGVPFPDNARLRELAQDPSALGRSLSAALCRFTAGEASKRPQLWLLDDAGDANPGVWELLRALLELEARVAILVTGRASLDADAIAVGSHPRAHRFALRPLGKAEIERLSAVLVPGLLRLPHELRDTLAERSRGNPRALVEIIRGLQDGGVFERRELEVVVDVARLSRGSLPVTIADSVRARLASLPPDELEVVHDAAVIGEHFWDGALLALRRARASTQVRELALLELFTPNDDQLVVQRALDALEAKGFIVLIGDAPRTGRTEYTFQHGGTRGLVYAAIDPALAARSHAVIAHWLTVSAGLAAESLPALVAPHLERAGRTQLAARAYLDAARAERARMRTTMALLYADRALALLDPDDVPTRLEMLHQRGALLSALGRYPDALQAFETIARVAWAIGALGRAGAALNRIARIHRERGEYALALEHLNASLELFDRADDQPGVASGYDDLAQIHRMRGELEPALTAARRALLIRVRLHDRRGQGVSLNTVGRIELDLGRLDAAEGRFRTALKIRRAIDDHEGAVQTSIALGQLAFRRGENAEAVRLYLDALEGARELSHARLQSYALHYLGTAYLALDDLDRAERALAEAKALASGLRDQHGLPEIERGLARLAERRQKPLTEQPS